MPDKSKLWKSTNGEFKQCFCIGPENCDDTDCDLVIKHRARQRPGDSQDEEKE